MRIALALMSILFMSVPSCGNGEHSEKDTGEDELDPCLELVCEGATPYCCNGRCSECCQESHCDDMNECTSDLCTDGTCSSEPLADRSSCTEGICCAGQCRPGGQCCSDVDCMEGCKGEAMTC